MKYAVMTFMYRGHIDRGDITHEGLVQLLADAGAQGIEAFDRDFLSDPSLIAATRRPCVTPRFPCR